MPTSHGISQQMHSLYDITLKYSFYSTWYAPRWHVLIILRGALLCCLHYNIVLYLIFLLQSLLEE